jgi:hypothetical protein
MTIAACHLSPEGVVLGADSTTSLVTPGNAKPVAHLDHAQKIFEVGDSGSTVGLVTWGIGQIGPTSHRSIAAGLGRTHKAKPFATLAKMADALGKHVWKLLQENYGGEMTEARAILGKMSANAATPEEIERVRLLSGALYGAYCLAGRVDGEDECSAYVVEWYPWYTGVSVSSVAPEMPMLWGMPHVMERVIYGIDSRAVDAILQSGKWNGTPQELFTVVTQQPFVIPRHLPIREAIDWIHTVIHMTIRGIKFAMEAHTCGGPVEIAAITTDRPFRWVLHKKLDAATVAATHRRGTYA